MNKKEKKQVVLKDIKNNYIQLERSIVDQLYLTNRLHGPTTGSYREDIWLQLFETILPQKFVIEHSVFIIDSGEGISNEVDLAILDEMYTPYIFRKGRLKFIPIEAVAAVVECKSSKIDEDKIKDWYESIVSLKTAGESIARLAIMIATQAVPTQKSTRPLRILCALKESVTVEIAEKFDFVLCAVESESVKDSHIEITANSNFENLFDWYTSLNFNGISHAGTWFEEPLKENLQNQKSALEDTKLEHYKVCDGDGKKISLLTFNFQFNQLLMLINNPLLFPHRNYAELFQNEGKGYHGE